MPHVRHPLEERFWPKVDKRTPEECWLWKGAITGMPSGTHRYGYLSALPAGKNGPRIPAVKAHRASWIIHNGPLPDGVCVLHRCDVPLCVNPSHLFSGSIADNNHDREAKGRGADRYGERNPKVKVTDQQVQEIRELYRAGARQVALAEQYGVVQPHISRIVRGVNR